MKEKKKKEKKEKVDKQLEKLEKTDFKVKRPVGKTIVAVILWIVVGFFFVKGLTVSFLAEDSTTVKEALSEHMDSLTQEEYIKTEVGTFAQNFAYDYYTYDSDYATEWDSRIKHYVSDYTLFSRPTGSDKQTVVSSELKGVNIISETEADVDVSVRVKYTTNHRKGKDVIVKTKTNVYIARIPVSMNKGNMAVVSTPMYVADTNNPGKVTEDFMLTGENCEEAVEKKIEKLTESFFGAYYGTKPSELSYYITKEFGSNAVAGGGLEFSSLSAFDVRSVGNKYNVKATAVITDGAVDIEQTCFLTVVKGSENRFYVSGMSTRQPE